MKQKRAEREEKEKQEALEKERVRIKSGKDITEIKRKMEEDEMKKIVEQRKREKEDEKKARQRVKDLIESDKAARKAKLSKNDSVPVSLPPPTPAPSTSAQPVIATPPKDYKETRIQLRLPDGSSVVETFDKNESLAAVRLFLQLKLGNEPLEAFSLMTTFPRKVFNSDDFDMTLEKLQLVPSATIMVAKNPKPGM